MKFDVLHSQKVAENAHQSTNLLGYGDVPLLRGTFFLKRAELSVSSSLICAELWVPFEETCRVMGTFLGNVAMIVKKSKEHATVV